MKILALDIGTGTQDILLFDSGKTIENCVKMVMPSPTVIAAGRIRAATAAGKNLVLTGVNMGGGPVTDALRSHLHAGLAAYATPEAAETFDDDLRVVQQMGVVLADEEELQCIEAAHMVELKDLDLSMVRRALAAFDVSPDWDALAVAVFDHGKAPPGYSDRKFRFEHLRRQSREGEASIADLGYLRPEIPSYMTRMLAVARTAGEDVPLLVMDSAEATILGELEDRHVRRHHCKVLVNLGNEHTLAFHLHGTTIRGVFEHHTHLLASDRLEDYILRLVSGDLDGDGVWRDQGHGAIAFSRCEKADLLAVTGPLRRRLEGSSLSPYFAAPHGDMMLAGAFGLVRAWARKQESWREEIDAALGS